MTIPAQLRDNRYGFLKLRGQTKIPLETGWQKKPYRFKDIEAWISTGNNYGVMGGEGGLIILDADKKRISEIADVDLPKTFTVRTPKCGHHYYFLCADINRKIVLNKDRNISARSYRAALRLSGAVQFIRRPKRLMSFFVT